MWLLKAPVEKFGRIPAGAHIITKDVPFYHNHAYSPKWYWTKTHIDNGCVDVTPRYLKTTRQKRDIQNILVIAKGGVGDVLFVLPFIRALRVRYEKCQILILTDERSLSVFQNFPYIQGAVLDNTWNLQGLLSAADEIYDFGGIKTVYKKFMKLDPVEAIFKMGELPLPKEKKHCRPHLVLTAKEGTDATALIEAQGINLLSDTVVAIATDSSTANRDWPLTFTNDLSRLLKKDGIKSIWLSEKSELTDTRFIACPCGWQSTAHYSSPPTVITLTCPRCKQAIIEDISEAASGITTLAGKTSLRQFMAVIALADCFVGPNSSGIVFATSLDIPCVGIFGAFNPQKACKFYEKFTAVWGKAKCAPCAQHWTECPEGHPSPCMRMITPQIVYDAVKSMLTKYPRTKRAKLPTM